MANRELILSLFAFILKNVHRLGYFVQNCKFVGKPLLMENTKLYGILRTLTPAEHNDLTRYLSADFFHVGPRSRELYAFIQVQLHEDKEIGKKDIFEKFFPREEYDDKKVRYLLTDLTKSVEDYLAYRAFRKDEALQQSLLGKALAEKGAEKAYNSVFTQVREKALSSKVKDADFYYYNYVAEYNHLVYEISRLKRNDRSNMELVVSNLDKFYLARKLQLCCEIFNVRNVLSIDYKVFLLDEILGYLRDNSYDDTPIITIYYQILMTLLEVDKEEHFNRLRELLRKHGDNFTLAELRDMYQYVFNYCIKKINLGNLAYQKVLFETYKETLSNGALLLEGHISQWDYKNIVTISLRLKEFAWAKEFIHEYRVKLSPKERENAFVYNLAYWHFHSKEYSKTLSLLQQVSFSDLYYQLDTRAILLKIYYEQDDLDALFYHIAAFKTFLQRNKLVSDYQRTIYKNLIRYTGKLAKSAGNAKKASMIMQEIEKKRQVADIQWLQQKVAELC
jgi:hypothetical protein